MIGADVTDPQSVEVDDQVGMRDYVQLPKDAPMADQASTLYRGVKDFIGKENALLDAVVVASGGWAGDAVMGAETPGNDDSVDPEEEYIRQSASTCERMTRMNYQPVVCGGLVARRFVRANGLFVMIGASAALSPTPGMLGYGSAKAAAHHFLQSYGSGSMRDDGITSVGILPLMIDTPDNRMMLGGDDVGDDRYSKMVKPVHIANEISDWIRQPHLRPHSGSLVKVIAKNDRQGRGGPAFHLVR